MNLLLSILLNKHHYWQRFLQRINNPNLWMLLGVDVLFVTVAHLTSYAVRFDFQFQIGDMIHQLRLIPLFLCIRLPIFYASGMYSGMWRYTSIRDLWNICKGVLISSLAIISFLVIQNRFTGYSRSVVILDTLFLLLLVSATRISIRLILHGQEDKERVPKKQRKQLLIIGAGGSGEKICREIIANRRLNYNIVGFLDDDSNKKGQRIHNVPVWGGIDDLHICVNEIDIDEILIAISAISGSQMQRIVASCKKTELPYKIIPDYGEVIDGRATTGMREISYKDLLGREEINLDIDQIGGYLTGKTVLITGGGGSIGSELTRQVTRFKPQTIVIYDAGEENLYNIQMELLHEYGLSNVVPILGKVQDQSLLNTVFDKYRPDVVFHAAAYKHVPLIENNPWQAVDNNIIASQILIEAAIIYEVNRFVIVSTDKAVRPTNVMGASKRMVELLMSAYRKKNWQGNLSEGWDQFVDTTKVKHKTMFMAVRFGNVLGSSGSVIPLFKKQIKNGGPITVTHPEVTRYFMSIEEAAQLILQAGTMAKGGEIYILKMGESVQILNLAKDLIELAGKKVGEDIDIIFTGLRPGEKLYEELITDGEGIIETGHEKIMVLEGEGNISDNKAIDIVKRFKNDAIRIEDSEVKLILKDILPEYAEMTK